MKRVLSIICLAQFLGFSCQSAGLTNRWDTFVLWSNQVVSASLKYLPEASVADEDYMFVELENHTDKTLDVAQAWLGLPGTRTDKKTQKSAWMGNMCGGVIYIGTLPPGKTKAVQRGVFAAGLANLGLPPAEGFHVELTPKADLRLADGTRFSTPDVQRSFHFEFCYPNSSEIETIQSRFKHLLAHPDDQIASGYYLNALSLFPEVKDSVTFEELLSALKGRSPIGGKEAITRIIGQRFPNDPEALSYFVDQLSRDDGDAFFSFPREIWQNPVFIEPLVKRYEKNRNNSTELLQLRSAWITNGQIVARLSTALLKKHPVLNQDVAKLSGADLCHWRSAVSDAGMVGDTNFLKWLEPALDDRRTIPDCISKHDSRPRPIWNPRICDCAMEAILMILDGDSWSAFKNAGIEGWSTQKEAYAAHDRLIPDLKKRLRMIRNSPAKE